MTETRRDRLVGSILSLPTFTDEEYNLRLDRQRKHLRWALDRGIKEGTGVILIAGGVGETYMLEDEEFEALVELAIDEVNGEAPTMVMVVELSARKAASKAKFAADASIDFVLLGPPHYTTPSEEDIYLHHKYVNDRADIGIVLYNSFWVMPGGYSYSRDLFARLAELENVEGVKWSSLSINDYVGFQAMFGDEINFIENWPYFSQGPRFGMKGTVDVFGNVAPRLSLHKLDLLRSGKFDEYDALWRQLNFDQMYLPGTGGRPAAPMVADGPHAEILLKILGLDAGPSYPGQAQPPPEYVEYHRTLMENSGIMDWVDWDQSILD